MYNLIILPKNDVVSAMQVITMYVFGCKSIKQTCYEKSPNVTVFV